MNAPKNSSLGGEAVRLTASKFITLCITLATTMLLSRYRSTEEYGTYSELLLVINLVTSLLMLGLPNSINYFLARADTQEERRHFLSVYYTLSTLLSAVIGAILVLALPLIERFFHNPGIRAYCYFLVLYPWATIISASIENVLVVYKQTRFLMLFRIVHSAAMLGVVLAVQWIGCGFQEYMAAFVAVNAAFAAAVYLIAAKLSGGLRPSFDRKLIRAVFVFSIPMGLATAVGTLNAEIDKLLIGYLLNTEQLAIYTNAAKELPVVIVAASITAVLLPQLTRMIKVGNVRGAIELWNTATELAFIVVALLVAGIFTYAEDVLTFLYSEKYLPGVQVFRIYTLNLLLRCTYFGIILNACGQTKKIFYCSLGSLGLNIVLNPLFYWLFGMIGPAIATFVAILAILLLQLRMTAKLVDMPFAAMFPWKAAAAVLAVNAGFSAVFHILKKLLPAQMFLGELGESLLLGAVWSLLYLLMMKKKLLSCWHQINRRGEQSC